MTEAGMERFYVEHGMIHDRNTGKHVSTDPDTVYGVPGIMEALYLLLDLDKAASKVNCPANARRVLYNEARRVMGNPMECVTIKATE